jgi:hypothetical protein
LVGPMCIWKPLSVGGGLMQYSSPFHEVFNPHSSIASLTGPPAAGCIAGGVVADGVFAGGVTGVIAGGFVAVTGGVLAGGAVDEAVGVVGCCGVVAAGGAADALLPAAPVGCGVFTVAPGPPVLSPPPHAERMAATPKHVAIRDLMSASNIGSRPNKNASCPLST